MGSDVRIRRGRAKPLWRGHPWVYRDSIVAVDDGVEAGDLVTVRDPAGRAIGCGFFSPGSAIAVRILSREEWIETDRAFFVDRLRTALRLRTDTLQLPVFTDAFRVVHSEGDRLPGLVADLFGGHLVAQLSTAGLHRRRDLILDALEEVIEPESIHLKPDKKACAAEGIPVESGLVRGAAPADPPSILEHGVCFRIDLGGGQKTGFFTDQRYNRQLVGRLVRGRRVLDLHTYTGGFGLHAAVNGAREVICIDSSGPALALAAENAMLNNCRQLRVERADARRYLDEAHESGKRVDVVISDPPRLAPTRAAVKKALRVYRDLHLRAMRVVEPGGLLAASSCSGSVSEEEFEATLRDAAYDLGRTVQVIFKGGQAPDHPVLTTSPEGRYLKFLLVCVG